MYSQQSYQMQPQYYQNQTLNNSSYQQPPFYQTPFPLESRSMPYNYNIRNQQQNYPQQYPPVKDYYYPEQYQQYQPAVKENYPYQYYGENNNYNYYQPGEVLGLQKSIAPKSMNTSQVVKINASDENLQELAEQLFSKTFVIPLHYSLKDLSLSMVEIKNTVAKQIPRFYKMLTNFERMMKQTEHAYNYFMTQPDILPNTFFSGLQHYLADKLSVMTQKVNQKLQGQIKKGVLITQPNINEVKTIRRTEVKQQFTFIEHRKQMRKKILKLSNNIINSFLLQNSTGSKLMIQQFMQICLKIITLFNFLCLDNTSLSPFVTLNSALLFDQITTIRKRLRPFDFLIITNENYEAFENQMKNYTKQYQQFSTRNQNIINQLHQIIVKEAQLEEISLINFNELANSVMYREKNKFQTEVLKSYQEIARQRTSDNENFLHNDNLVETGEQLRKEMEEWSELRNDQIKYGSIMQDILRQKITSGNVQMLDMDFEQNVSKISRIEKTMNFASALYEKSTKLVENVMAYKQDQEDFLEYKYEDILAGMHNSLKSKFCYFNVHDQMNELFSQLKELLKYEKLKSKDITHKIEKQIKKGKYKNEFLKQVQHTIELDQMMRSKEEQFIKAQEQNMQMQTYWQQQNISLLQQQQMEQYNKARQLAQQSQTNFALTRQLTQLAQQREQQMKSNDQNIHSLSQNVEQQQQISNQYDRDIEQMKENHQKQNEEIKKQIEEQIKAREELRQKELLLKQQEREERQQKEEEAIKKRQEEYAKRAEERAERERKLKEEQEEQEQKMKERREERERKEKEDKIKKMEEQKERDERLKAENEEKQRELDQKKKKEKEERDKKEKERQEKAQRAKEEEQRKIQEQKEKKEQLKREKEERDKREREEKEKKYQELKEREEKEKKDREERLKREKELKAEKDREEREKKERELNENKLKEAKLKEQREKELKDKKIREEQERKEREEKLRKEKEDKDRKDRERREREAKEKEDKDKKLKEEKDRKDREAKEKKEREEKDKREREEQLKKDRELKAQKEKEEKEKKEREEKEKKQKLQKEKEERERKEREAKEKKDQEAREARERIEKERLAKEQKEKEERERKAREEKERKDKEERDKKALQEKEKKDKEERDRKAREEKEKKDKEERDRKAREEKEKKDKEERDRKEKEKKEKEDKNKNKKRFEDEDDYLDDFDSDIPLPIEESPENKKKDDLIEEMMSSQDKPKKNRMQAVQDFDDAFEFDDDEEEKVDFGAKPAPQQQDDQMENEPNFLQPEQLINIQLLDLNNLYAQSIGFDQMDINFEEYNNFESIFMLFEEFIIQSNAYLFDFEVGQALEQLSNELAILQQSQNEEDAQAAIEPKLQGLIQSVIQQIIKMIKVQMQYQQIAQSEEFSKQTRYFFPFESSLSYFLIEVNPHVQRIIIYFSESLNMEQQQEVAATMENMIQLIFCLLEFPGSLFLYYQSQLDFEIMNIEVPPPTKEILKEFETLPYIQYMLTMFYIIYELDLPTFLACNFTVLIDEKMISRMGLVLSAGKNMRALMMDEQGQESYQMMFEQMIQMYNIETNPEMKILIKHLQLTEPDTFMQMIQQELSSELQLIRRNQIEHAFLAIDIALQNLRHTYYIYIGKTSPEEEEQTKKKFSLIFYFFHGYSEEINQSLMEIICESVGLNLDSPNLELEMQQNEFGLQSFFDYVRNSFPMEFSRVTLGLWVHLSFSRSFGPVNALMLMSYSQLPNFAEFYMMQEQDEEPNEDEIKEMLAIQEAQQKAVMAEAAMQKKVDKKKSKKKIIK